MFGTIRKVISFVTLITTFIIAIRELKIAVDGFRNSGRAANNNKTASDRA